jgi:hypothetical protein
MVAALALTGRLRLAHGNASHGRGEGILTALARGGAMIAKALSEIRSRVRYYRPRRNSIVAAFTSAARSCWVQWPQPGSMIAARSAGTKLARFGISRSMPGKLTTGSRSPACRVRRTARLNASDAEQLNPVWEKRESAAVVQFVPSPAPAVRGSARRRLSSS